MNRLRDTDWPEIVGCILFVLIFGCIVYGVVKRDQSMRDKGCTYNPGTRVYTCPVPARTP